MMMIQTMMLKTHLPWDALSARLFPIFAVARAPGTDCLRYEGVDSGSPSGGGKSCDAASPFLGCV
jgi:hypothetical protein